MSVLLLWHWNLQIKPSFFKVWVFAVFSHSHRKMHDPTCMIPVLTDCLANVSQGPFFLWAALLAPALGLHAYSLVPNFYVGAGILTQVLILVW